MHQGLDLKLTPYRVIATSPSTGMVERVVGNPLSRVLADHSRDIKAFFRHHHPDRTGPYGVKASVMDNYVKSTAGYCVVTYLLGVGLSERVCVRHEAESVRHATERVSEA